MRVPAGDVVLPGSGAAGLPLPDPFVVSWAVAGPNGTMLERAPDVEEAVSKSDPAALPRHRAGREP